MKITFKYNPNVLPMHPKSHLQRAPTRNMGWDGASWQLAANPTTSGWILLEIESNTRVNTELTLDAKCF